MPLMIDNFIVGKHTEIKMTFSINYEFIELYNGFNNAQLREIFATLHHEINSEFRSMNSRLPTGVNGAHFGAENSRSLIKLIDIVYEMQSTFKGQKYEFDIDEYYNTLFSKCRSFLSTSGGSTLPPNMEKVVLYYITPIFIPKDAIKVSRETDFHYELKLIGEGAYAHVFKYKDTFYNRQFIVKRAKKDLNEKELARFKREFSVMQELSSPYVVEVYMYDDSKNQYIMEYMDETLYDYIQKNNASLTVLDRKRIINQILRGFSYIHAQKQLHRDISPYNILIKKYDDCSIVKISDFGLVKIPDSTFTSYSTELKGVYNDPALLTEGFDTYSMEHETYALTKLVYFVLTGKTNMSHISNQVILSFVTKGTNPDKTQRYKSVDEIYGAISQIR